MPSADKREYPDELLTRYLLGAAKASESEQLDELSIVDNELAWRLDALEQDLVDAFVRNELFGETLERFEKHYLSSPARREKVEIARTLLKCNEKRVSEKRVAGGKRVEAVASAKQLTAARFDWLRSGLAGAAIALCALAAYLFVENNRLRKLRTDAQIQQAILDQRVRQLEKQLTERGSTNNKTTEQTDRESGLGERPLKTIAVLLLPATRGLGQVANVVIPVGTERVTLRMQLESDDFPVYGASLKDPASGTTVWSDANLKAKSEGQKRVAAASVPTSVLKQQNYSLELSGIPVQGAPETVSSYAFKVVLR